MNARAARFPLFDSLRAIAALAVLTTHAAFYSSALASEEPWVRQFAARFDVGVTVFFLISAFLLYRPFAHARLSGEPPPRVGPYAWRRFLRIVPAYWLALTAFALWFGEKGIFTPVGALRYYAFGQIYQADTVLGGLGQAWTLCVEVTFYAFLPLWALVMRRLPLRSPAARLRGELVALALLAAGSIAFKLAVLAGQGPGSVRASALLFVLPTFLDQFALGMAIALLSVWYQDRPRPPLVLRVLDRAPSLAWLFAFGALFVVATQIGLTGHFAEANSKAQFMYRHLLYTAVALGVILPAVFGDQRRGLVRRLLANPVLLWLGTVSYGIYLWHQTVFLQLYLHGPDPTGLLHPYVGWELAGLAGAVALAAASYYLLERPLLRLKRLVPDRARVARGEVLAEAPLAPAVARAAAE